MKFAIFAPVAGVVALKATHPTVNLVLTNDGSNMDASFAQSKAKTIRGELADLVKSETHASLLQGDFNQPNVIRINYENPHSSLLEGITRESIDSASPYEAGEIGLNLIPGGASAASLKQLMDKSDADFETEFRAGLHASLIQSPATRIRLPRGGFTEGSSFVSDDGRIAVRVLPARHIPGFTQKMDTEEKVNEFLSLFSQGKVSKKQLQEAADQCAGVLQSEGASDAMRASCGSVITHQTGRPVAASIMDPATGGHGHVFVVLPSPSRVYGA
jgi:hypothetical protein